MPRPASATVFGILNIAFGGLGLLGSAWSWVVTSLGDTAANPVFAIMEESAVYTAWTRLGLILGAIASVVLIASGIGLLKMGRWARIAAVGYGIYGIVMTLAGGVMSWFFLYAPLLDEIGAAQDPTQQGAMVGGLVGGLAGGCFGLIYPAALLYFMTRPGLVAVFEGIPVPEAPASAPAPPPVVVANSPVFDGANPYAPPTAPLQTRPEAPPATGDEVIATVIPFRNKPALIAYYLGVFSLSALIPLLGVVGVGMAIAAFVLGIKGRRLAKENPQAKGMVHAWVGILCGALWGVLGILMQALMVVAILAG